MEGRGTEVGRTDEDSSAEPANWSPGIVPEWDQMLVSALQLTGSLMRARQCALFLLDGDRGRLVLARMWDESAGSLLRFAEVFPGSLEWDVVQGQAPTAGLRSELESLGLQNRPEFSDCYPCACVPVNVEGTRFGVVEVIRGRGDSPFLLADLDALQLVARHVGLWLRNSAILQQLRELAITDGLTEVFNHRYFLDRLSLEMERSLRYERQVSLLMLDLNRFKQFNDLFGHQHGDVALHQTASAIRGAVRRIDVVARYGGDEFAIILPETSSPQALVAAARIARAVAKQGITAPGGASVDSLSASIGISSYPNPAQSREELIGQADEALYRAKRSRGRQIWLWEPGLHRAPVEEKANGRVE